MERRQKEENKKLPLATLIRELQKAVLVEGNRLRGSLDIQPGASASSAAQPTDPPVVPGAASSAEQPAATSTAAECRAKRSMGAGSAAQPGRPAKAPRQGASPTSASATIVEALQTRGDDLGDVRPPPGPHEDACAARRGPMTKQRRLTAMFPPADTQQAGAAASSSSTPPRLNKSNPSAAQPGPPTTQQRDAATSAVISSLRGDFVSNASVAQPGAEAAAPPPAAAASSSKLPARPELPQHSILEYGSHPDDLAELRKAMFHMVKELRRLKRQTAAGDDGAETLAMLLTQAQTLQQAPATQRTLDAPEIRSLSLLHALWQRLSYQTTLQKAAP